MAKEKTSKINVQGTAISILSQNDNDFISLTDMLKAKDGDFFIADWLRNRNTIEYLGIWEKINNPLFNYGEFAIIKNISGSNSFSLAPKRLIELNQMAIRQLKALSSNTTIKKLGNE